MNMTKNKTNQREWEDEFEKRFRFGAYKPIDPPGKLRDGFFEVKQFIRSQIEQARRETAEDICILIEDIESKSQTNTLEEWRQYKAIRNAIRDKYVLDQLKKGDYEAKND